MPGARNSKRDAQELREAKRKAAEVSQHIENAGIMDEPEEESKALLMGDAVKALGNGKIGGYLVRFSGAYDPDLVGDFFTPETDFGASSTTNVLYHHGQDIAIKARSLGSGTLRKDGVGVWVEAQLRLADEYEQAIYEMVKAGKLRWSSGTAPHLVERQPVGKAMWIKNWPLGLDASLTPTPAEPRNAVIMIKAKRETMDMNTENTTTKTGAVPPPAAPAAHDRVGELETHIKTLQEQNATLEQRLDEILHAPPIRGGYAIGGQQQNEDSIKAFGTYLRSGAIKASMQVGESSEGGYLVPHIYSNELILALKEASIMRTAGARIISIGGTKAFSVPKMTHFSTAATLTNEEAAYIEAEPTFGEITFYPYKYTKLVRVSEELLVDSRIDIMSQVLNPDFTVAFAAAENTDFVTGSGSNRPEGITQGAALGVTAASATALTADELIDLYHSVGHLYRNNAVWLMADTTVKAIRKLKDGTGQYLWQPGLQAGQPDRILNRQVYTIDMMPTIGTGNRSIVFGDMRYFWIVDFGMDGIRRLNELYAVNGQVGFVMMKRIDSHVMLDAAIKYLVHP